ncbi:MAG: acyltransferase [Planctomycetes bacterium]|nr:acyltransferase [Planctomycetota bacterium]
MSIYYHRLLYPGFRVGRKTKARGRFCVVMYGEGEITLGEKCRIYSNTKRSDMALYSPCKFTTYPGAKIVIGNRVSFGGTIITCRKSIVIEDDAMFAANVIIVDSDFHVPWPPERRHDPAPPEAAREVRIGRNAWVGINVIILKGVTIGEDAVIGAGSVVTRDVPPRCVAAGNPARVIRRLDEAPAGDANKNATA